MTTGLISFLKRFKILRNSTFLKEVRSTYGILLAKIRYLWIPANHHAERSTREADHATFKDYYMQIEVLKMKGTLARNPDHIGKNISGKNVAEAGGRRWLDYLISNGLRPDHTVIEYGCGSLRVGKAVIDYLNQGHYVGVDIDSFFYEMGLRNYVGEELIAAKAPSFYVIDSPKYAAATAGRTFDFLFSTLVLMHVPPQQLDKFFANIVKLMHAGSVYYFDFQPALFCIRKNSVTWGYPYGTLFKYIRNNGARCEILEGHLVKMTL